MTEPHDLKAKGATWWHTDDYASPNLSKSSLGDFFFHVLKSGAYVGEVWPFNYRFKRSLVVVSVFMTDAQRAEIEAATRVRFRPPPKITLNSGAAQ